MATIKKTTKRNLLTRQQRSYLLSSALEGGSNYWYILPTETMTTIRKYKVAGEDNYVEDIILKAVKAGESLAINDYESEEEELGCLNKESIKKGEEIMFKDYKSHFADILNENFDATTGDVWFQLCVLGDIIYG